MKAMIPSLPKDLNKFNQMVSSTTQTSWTTDPKLKEDISACKQLAGSISETEAEKEQAAIKEFECPICLSYAAPPIMMCQRSHIVCNMCWKKCYNCPTCRAPKTLTRALVLENIYPLLTFPCKYEGCSFQGNGAFTPIHEQSCMFYPIACPLSKAFECTWRGPIGYTQKHLIENHRANVYFEPSVKLVSRGLGYCNKKNYTVIFCCFGRIFRFSLEYDRSISPDVKFNMVQIGSRKDHESFRYILKFFNTFPIRQGNQGCVATQAVVSKDFNELQSTEHNQSQLTQNAKWRLHFNHLVSYCTVNSGDFFYEVTLENKHFNFRKTSFKKYHTYRR